MPKLIETKDAKAAYRRINAMETKVRAGIRWGLSSSARRLKRTLRKNIAAPKHGRVYKYKGRIHIASRPGETPAKLTGKYKRNIKTIVKGDQELEFGIDSTIYYPKWLEQKDGPINSNLEPRPGLKIAIKENDKIIEVDLTQSINFYIKK
jgi:hypothetical protein